VGAGGAGGRDVGLVPGVISRFVDFDVGIQRHLCGLRYPRRLKPLGKGCDSEKMAAGWSAACARMMASARPATEELVIGGDAAGDVVAVGKAARRCGGGGVRACFNGETVCLEAISLAFVEDIGTGAEVIEDQRGRSCGAVVEDEERA